MENNNLDINNYQLFIFDYDATLYILDTDAFKQDSYKNSLYDFLYNLKQKGKTLAIASHNVSVHQFIKNSPHLFEFFEDNFILGEYPINKAVLVTALMSSCNCTKEQTIFFDDRISNIQNVENIGVKSILVDPYLGINFRKFT